MPRPTVAQLAYGSLTVILSTAAMLLLSQTSSGVWISLVAVVALGLGLLVAMTVPTPRPRPVAVDQPSTATADPAPVSVAPRATDRTGETIGRHAA